MSAVPGVGFIDFPDPATGAIALVLQLSPEHRPARIEHAFRHVRFSQASGVHIANEDGPMFFDKPGAELVQKVFSAIGNLGVDRLGTLLVACPLGHRQNRLQVSVELLRFNGLPIGQRRKILQPKLTSSPP